MIALGGILGVGFVAGLLTGILVTRRWVLRRLESEMVRLGRERDPVLEASSPAEAENSCPWPEIPLYERAANR